MASGTVVFVSGDLVFASRVRAAAESAGFAFVFGGNIPNALDEVRFVIIDLGTMSKKVEAIWSTCQEQYPGTEVIAYGPHVQEANLQAAKDAGIQHVLTRGQFNHQLPTLFNNE